MTEFTASSGAKIMISIAPWGAAKQLKKAIEFEIGRQRIDIISADSSAELLSLVMRVDSSDAVEAALWPCLERCTRDNAKIVPSTFDTKEGRADYYEIVMACVKENFGPFAATLYLLLGVLGLKLPEEPKPVTAPEPS